MLSRLNSLLNTSFKVSYYLEQMNTQGRLVYEYNPFRVLRNPDNPNDVLDGLDIRDLNFKLNHPVDIQCQQSYDDSVNLIINDGYNIPRLINSRFSARENNMYEIVDRLGDSDTNIYDKDLINQQTSLHKQTNTIATITFNGISHGGNLPVGNYVFYFKLADADGNESEFIGESSMVSCFIGDTPDTINGGIQDMNSYKAVRFELSNLDKSYSYVSVYYSRSTSDSLMNDYVTEYKKVDYKYRIQGSYAVIYISGFEQTLDITESDINAQYFVADSAKAQAIAQNMLFLGNVTTPDIVYKEFRDLSLRIIPTVYYENYENSIGNVSCDNYSITNDTNNFNGGGQYYNPINIYSKVGYWNEEMYRFAIVYILENGTLSPAFNIRGVKQLYDETYKYTTNINESLWQGDSKTIRSYIEYDEYSGNIKGAVDQNAFGVVRFNEQLQGLKVYGIKFNMSNEVREYLQNVMHIRGYFFVRQKRIPTIMCQAVMTNFNPNAGVPLVKGVHQGFLSKDCILTPSTITEAAKVSLRAAIAPEFELKQAYFNNYFTGESFQVKKTLYKQQLKHKNKHIYSSSIEPSEYSALGYEDRNIVGVTTGCKSAYIGDQAFREEVGDAITCSFSSLYYDPSQKIEDFQNYKYGSGFVKNAVTNQASLSSLVRGIYGPYLGMSEQSKSNLKEGDVINIYVPGYSINNINDYFKIRMQDSTPYYTVSPRYNITVNCSNDIQYRGDCFICNYTHRIIRNFSSATSPANDIIVNPSSFASAVEGLGTEIINTKDWQKYTSSGLTDAEDNLIIQGLKGQTTTIAKWGDGSYRITSNEEKLAKVNVGDLNAVQLGLWVTVKICASSNISLRSLDYSYPSEEALYGHKRGFYPLFPMSASGAYKIPDSTALNKGFGQTTSSRMNILQSDVPTIKNKFQTRIYYSNIGNRDSFVNGLRVFKATNYMDYSTEYGGLMKLMEFNDNLVAVFEHAVAVIIVNERAQIADAEGGNVYLTTQNVLSENLNVISNTYGSQWPNSIIKTPRYIYGVDTVAKKIWRFSQQGFEIISDFNVEKFLIDHISLNDREMTPVIGIRDVRTHYNAFKQDILFTFYDDLNNIEEEAWNLCYNEIMQKFVTFYSWMPVMSENINNTFFTFNRDTSKWIAKSSASKSTSEYAESISIDPLKEGFFSWNSTEPVLFKLNIKSLESYGRLQDLKVKYEILPDPYKWFKSGIEIKNINNEPYLYIPSGLRPIDDDDKGIQLNLKATVLHSIDLDLNGGTVLGQPLVTQLCILNNADVLNVQWRDGDKSLYNKLSSNFYKHGESGTVNLQKKIKPCFWYGKQHPFEFEFIIGNQDPFYKQFTNMQIIGNNVKPESLHYMVLGDSYDFAQDKLNMYFRQEITKYVYQSLGSNVRYDTDVNELTQKVHPTGTPYKATMFPLFYNRVDTINAIEDKYVQVISPLGKDYRRLTGAEVIWNKPEDKFYIWNHCPALDIKQVGRMRGNLQYINDKWEVQINPFIMFQKNEVWKELPPINLGNSPIPNDVISISQKNMELALSKFNYTFKDLDITKWTARKEFKPLDRYLRVRLRYDGKEKCFIQSINSYFLTYNDYIRQ